VYIVSTESRILFTIPPFCCRFNNGQRRPDSENIYCVHRKFVSHTSPAVSRATHLTPAQVTTRKLQFDRKSNISTDAKKRADLVNVFLRQIDRQRKYIVTVTDLREYCVHVNHGKLIYTLVDWSSSPGDQTVHMAHANRMWWPPTIFLHV